MCSPRRHGEVAPRDAGPDQLQHLGERHRHLWPLVNQTFGWLGTIRLPRMGTLERDLQRLIDTRAIEGVMIEYFDRVDALDPFGAVATFADDATADLMTGKVYRGRTPIGRAPARILLQYRHTSHHISNHRSRIDGDTASALTHIYAFHRFRDGRIWHLWARHVDRLSRIDGRWLLTDRVLVAIDADPPWDAVDESRFREHPGRRDPATVQAELDGLYRGREDGRAE